MGGARASLRAALNNPDLFLLPAPTESVELSWGEAALGAPAWAKPPTSPKAALGIALTVDVGGRNVLLGTDLWGTAAVEQDDPALRDARGRGCVSYRRRHLRVTAVRCAG